MSDFDFTALAIKPDKLVELPLYQLPGVPVLLVLPATEENKAFFNDAVRSEKAFARMVAGNAGPELYAKKRDDDVTLFARHVIKDWRGVFDKNGTVVSFSPRECEAFLAAIVKAAPDLFSEIRSFCQDRSNFGRSGSVIDAEGAAKNS